ncbi:MAG: polyprenyl synthetase family protein [Planctomycetota bacterium]
MIASSGQGTARHHQPNGLRSSAAVPHRLWEEALTGPSERFLTRFGKRIRAEMVNESFRMAGGQGDPPPQVAESIELLHAGSLIVDDIEDDSAQRRGHPTLHREIGVPLALNTGNWMYFRSLERLSDTRLDQQTSARMVRQLVRTARRCHEGQALDLAASVDRLQPTEIAPTARAISRLKTGGLTAVSAWLGATAARAGRVTRNALGRFGMNVGICLQMHNDLMELRRFSEGDQRCDDLRNARVTWPWAWASQSLSKIELFALRHRLRKAPDDAEALRSIACRLVDRVGDQGNDQIQVKLQRSLTLLGEHVDSTRSMRSILSKLQRPG